MVNSNNHKYLNFGLVVCLSPNLNSSITDPENSIGIYFSFSSFAWKNETK